MPNSILILLATIAVLALVDYIPRFLLLRRKKSVVTPSYTKIPQYVIMPTVYGDISYLGNLKFFGQYADKVIICTTKHETKEFYRELRKICREHKFRYIRSDVPVVKGRPTKNPYAIYGGAFKNFYRLGIRADTPCLLMDADTYSESNINNLIRSFIESGLDVASLRCEVSKPKNTIEILQAYEYTMAMDNRSIEPWLTSGACNLSKAKIYQDIFSKHTFYFSGGDTEIGRLARIMGYKTGHLNFTFYTEVPATFKAWFRQRTIWFSGGIRHHIVNMTTFEWYNFFVFFYNSLLIYLLFPLRWLEVVNFPIALVFLLGVSWVYIFILNYGRGWRKEYFLIPFYGFVQSMVIIPFAVIRYLSYSLQMRNLGRIKVDMSRFNLMPRMAFRILNLSSAAFVLAIALDFTVLRFHYWYIHGLVLKDILGILHI